MSQLESTSYATLVLLPGMDGTGMLFKALTAALPESIRPVVVAYPPDREMGYPELEAFVEAALPAERRFVMLGESFSGPLALRIAARGHSRLAGIVLVASFARNPLPRLGPWLRPFVGSWCFRFAPPRWIVRRFLAGPDAPDDLVGEFQAAVRTVSPAVMAKRARGILSVDVRNLLPQIRVPVLLLSAARDRLVSVKSGDDFHVLRERFECVSIDAPHLILQLQPVIASQGIEEFLQRISKAHPVGGQSEKTEGMQMNDDRR